SKSPPSAGLTTPKSMGLTAVPRPRTRKRLESVRSGWTMPRAGMAASARAARRSSSTAPRVPSGARACRFARPSPPALSIATQQREVGELESAMDGAAGVDGRQRVGGAADDFHRVAGAERRASLPLREILAGEPLHRHEEAAVRSDAVRDVFDDVRVAQIGDDLDLALEPDPFHRRCRLTQDLEGDGFARDRVDRLEDVAAGAAAHPRFDDEPIV